MKFAIPVVAALMCLADAPSVPMVGPLRVIESRAPFVLPDLDHHVAGIFGIAVKASPDVVEVCSVVAGRAELCMRPTSSPVLVPAHCGAFDRPFLATVRVRTADGAVAETSRSYTCDSEGRQP